MRIVRLGDHVKFLSGFAFKSKFFNCEGLGLPIVRIRDVIPGYSETYYSGDYEEHYLVYQGDYLIGMDGNFNLSCWRSDMALLNQRVCKIHSLSKSLDRGYLVRFLPIALKEIEDATPFVTVKHLSVNSLNQIQIPLPPLAEQKRIATILDAADALRVKRRESLAQLDSFLQSTFFDMFGDPVANPLRWKMGVISDLLKSSTYGTSKKADSQKGSYPILRMNNITYSGDWDFSDLKYIDLDAKDLRKHLVHKGEILFNRTNSKELVGKTAVFRKEEPMVFAGYLVKGVVNESADPEYIGAFMNTPQTKKFLRSKCKNIVGMANINAKEFQKIPIPKPPINLQRRFATIVEAVEHQKVRIRAHLAELDILFASLQQRAFNGEM